MSATQGRVIFDADNHFYETTDALTRYLPERYKSRIRYVEVEGRTKLAINGVISDYIPNPTFDVVARPGSHAAFFRGDNPDGKTQRELTGEPMRAIPAFREPTARLELMDQLGIHGALMFPTLASVLEQRMKDDLELTHAAVHAVNQWIHEVWTFDYEGRIYATPVISLAVVEDAVRELDWALARGAKAVLVRPCPCPA